MTAPQNRSKNRKHARRRSRGRPFAPGVSGNPAKQFQPGESGNPGGRPKGFAGLIRERCGENFDKLVEGLVAIAFGNAAARRRVFGEPVKVTARDRINAIVELRDSGPGRPVQTLEHLGGDTWRPLFALPAGDQPSVSPLSLDPESGQPPAAAGDTAPAAAAPAPTGGGES